MFVCLLICDDTKEFVYEMVTSGPRCRAVARIASETRKVLEMSIFGLCLVRRHWAHINWAQRKSGGK